MVIILCQNSVLIKFNLKPKGLSPRFCSLLSLCYWAYLWAATHKQHSTNWHLSDKGGTTLKCVTVPTVKHVRNGVRWRLTGVLNSCITSANLTERRFTILSLYTFHRKYSVFWRTACL